MIVKPGNIVYTHRASSDAGDQQGSLINLPEQGAVVDDIRGAFVDFFKANVLIAQSVPEEGCAWWSRKVRALLTRRISMWAGYSGAVILSG